MVQHGQSSSNSHHGSSMSKGSSWLWTSKSDDETPPPKITKKSILIAVMGMTGAGKTTLISEVTGLNMNIGHGLKSCTKEIQVATMRIDGYEVHLIDTPGFDDTELTDSDILIRIAGYLVTDVRLSGILYLHPISTTRMGGAATRNLKMFQNLVGKDNMGNVKLITTKWAGVTPEQGQLYLKELVGEFWNSMIAAGAHVERCDDIAKDGKRIIQTILKTSPVTLRFQQEIQDGLQPEETAAYKVVRDGLDELQKKYDRDIQRLQEQLANTVPRGDLEMIQQGYEEAMRKQNETAEQKRKLLEADIHVLNQEVAKLKLNNWGCVIL